MLMGYVSTTDKYRERTAAMKPFVRSKQKCACGKEAHAKQLRQYGKCVTCARHGGRMKRSPMARSTTGLKRTAFAPSTTPLLRSTPFTQASPIPRKAFDSAALGAMTRQRRLRSRGPKMTPIRRSARGEDCTFNFPGICQHSTDTTVWCHSNSYADGKGMGIKANDAAGAYGCAACHAFYDGGWASVPHMSKEQAHQYFEIARAKSRLILKHKGLISE